MIARLDIWHFLGLTNYSLHWIHFLRPISFVRETIGSDRNNETKQWLESHFFVYWSLVFFLFSFISFEEKPCPWECRTVNVFWVLLERAGVWLLMWRGNLCQYFCSAWLWIRATEKMQKVRPGLVWLTHWFTEPIPLEGLFIGNVRSHLGHFVDMSRCQPSIHLVLTGWDYGSLCSW